MSDINDLRKAIEQNGSAIISISDPKAGSHSLIVDEISEKGVRVRCPYHGWAITVTKEAFKSRFDEDEAIIQIVNC